jgi:hypothetical protein
LLASAFAANLVSMLGTVSAKSVSHHLLEIFFNLFGLFTKKSAARNIDVLQFVFNPDRGSASDWCFTDSSG